jgi:outer membrane immunogenic protein
MGESMRALLATAAFAASIGAAVAADKGGHIIPDFPAAVPAVLAPSTSWTGCYIGGGGGYAISNTEVSVPGFLTIDGLGAEGHTFFAGGGCDIQMGQVVVGGWADYTWDQDHDFTISAFGGSISTGINERWAAGGRAGVLVGGALAYGLVGYTDADLDIGSHAGVVYGGGVELPIGSGFSLKTEYRYSDLETVRYSGIDVDPDVHEVRASLNYKIGVGR